MLLPGTGIRYTRALNPNPESEKGPHGTLAMLNLPAEQRPLPGFPHIGGSDATRRCRPCTAERVRASYGFEYQGLGSRI